MTSIAITGLSHLIRRSPARNTYEAARTAAGPHPAPERPPGEGEGRPSAAPRNGLLAAADCACAGGGGGGAAAT